MKNEKLSRLVEAAKGERSIREYSVDSGVNPTTISKIISKGYTPSSGVIKKLGSPKAAPRGNVTVQDLMIAAGFSEDYIKTDILVDLGQEEDDSARSDANGRVELYREDSMRDFMRQIARYESIAEGVIYTVLVKKRIKFSYGDNSDLSVRGFRPDIFVELQDGSSIKWWFDFKKFRDVRKGMRMPNSMYARRILDRYIIIEPDKNRKISIVLDDEKVFDAILSYKGKTSYRGDLSIILIDIDEICVKNEEYIAFYDLDDDEDNKIKLI